MRPMLLPMTLPFPPPNFLAPRIEIILSIIKINKAIIKLKTRKKVLIVIEEEKLNIKSPLHDVKWTRNNWNKTSYNSKENK